MTKKRNRLEIIHDILKVISVKREAKPTHILYKSNLSHTLMEEYLKELKEKNFIKEEIKKNRKLFSITTKGENYLKEYNRVIRFTESFGLTD